MDERLLRFYTEHQQRFGSNDPRGLGWRDADSQQVRFAILAEVGDLTDTRVLDEGCGFGDLYPFLQGRYTGIRYEGIDINSDAIRAAREKYPDASFETADFDAYAGGPFDYVLSSGALTFNMENAVETYQGHIRKMYDLCTKGVAFNVLDARAVADHADYLGWDPKEVRAFCNGFADRIIIRHDYSPEDFTVYLYR